MGATIRPFATDGCSDGGIQKLVLTNINPLFARDVLLACLEHDFAYWQGGPMKRKAAADQVMRAWIQTAEQRHGITFPIGTLYRAAVTAFGAPWLPTSFRWGYGWTWPRYQGVVPDSVYNAAVDALRARREAICAVAETVTSE